jgi:signal transduction histidine kinase/ActR/RegA family two-component response regulator
MHSLSDTRRWFGLPRTAGQQSVRSKLMAVIVRTTAIALFLAAVAMSLVDMTAYRNARASQMSTEASILALATAPALAFDDHTGAQRSLAALRAHAAVMAAALYTPDGSLYASYAKAGQAAPPAMLSSAADSVTQSRDEVRLTQRITQNGEWLGTIYLRARFNMLPRILTYFAITLLVTVLGGMASMVLSTPLQVAISTPLDSMTRVASRVVDERDYSQRAVKRADDEIGLVVDAFNRMLEEVQLRTRALEASDAALREADRRKDEYLATLAHELRNPLAPIRNAAELLRIHAADDRRRQWAREIITRQVKRMGLLLDDLLDVSRISRQRLQLKMEKVSLAAVVSTAVETARPLIDAKQHSLQVSLPSEPIELDADPLRLSQAISNLLNNAAKYTDPCGLIRLSAEVTADVLRIAVSDNGIGVDPEVVPTLFQMFAQIHSPIDRTEGGLGIGLALVRGLVELHGGTVEAVSAGSGQGSTFTIRLPGARIGACQSRHDENDSRTRTAHGPTRRILVADDNVDAAESLALIIKTWNHEIRVAQTGSAALEIALRDRPDVCILDIGMPGMSGYEVARGIRSQPWGHETVLFALTGWGQSEDVERAKAAGFNEHMTKPVDLARLAELLANHGARVNDPALLQDS